MAFYEFGFSQQCVHMGPYHRAKHYHFTTIWVRWFTGTINTWKLKDKSFVKLFYVMLWTIKMKYSLVLIYFNLFQTLILSNEIFLRTFLINIRAGYYGN